MNEAHSEHIAQFADMGKKFVSQINVGILGLPPNTSKLLRAKDTDKTNYF